MAKAVMPIPPGKLDEDNLRADFLKHFNHTFGRDNFDASPQYLFTAFALTIRDRITANWSATRHERERTNARRVCYLSMEFLLGRLLRDALLNIGGTESSEAMFRHLGLSLAEVEEREHEAGLGNGGLGRLAACFLDSSATLGLPVTGYGLRYQYGMFRQCIKDGFQVEEPDIWLRDPYPWEIERAELTQRVKFGGRVEVYQDHRGYQCRRWVGTNDVLAVPYDVPVPGYRNDVVNTLRLWSAQATDEFDLGEFNAGSYDEAVRAKNAAENVTMVLYPNDVSENGKELRLRQQYFLVSASLQDTVRNWLVRQGSLDDFADKHCFQLNDTHPSLGGAELMRILMDDHGMGWDEAWSITTRTMAYTNHTLMPEALERWPVRLFQSLLPRLLEIIYEINARFIAEVAMRWPGDLERQSRLSIIEQGPEPMVRMAHLAVVCSFSVNGVAELHSRLLREGLFLDFATLWPERFNNKTNGVTPRRWLFGCNPGLSDLISRTIGPGWKSDLGKLTALMPHACDEAFQREWRHVKLSNKQRLAGLIARETGVELDSERFLFDIQVKRIHEYKRQLLNALHVIHLYCRIKAGETHAMVPRAVIFAGKAAPGYALAKSIVKFINNVAHVINEDPDAQPWLRVVFLPNYRISAMEVIAPAADVSAQISTAGNEASGTGNMKFMMNGAITVGTLDGANVEIRDAVGDENFITFGMRAEDVQTALATGHEPMSAIAEDENLARVIKLIESHHFNQFEPGMHDDILNAVTRTNDPWMSAADFGSFVNAHERAAKLYSDSKTWTRMSVANVAASGRFSSDRTIIDYNRDIWQTDATAIVPSADDSDLAVTKPEYSKA